MPDRSAASGPVQAGTLTHAAPSRTALARRARRINRELARLYPDARIELNFTSPLELLVAALLSAQATDRRVNEVTRVLFARRHIPLRVDLPPGLSPESENYLT